MTPEEKFTQKLIRGYPGGIIECDDIRDFKWYTNLSLDAMSAAIDPVYIRRRVQSVRFLPNRIDTGNDGLNLTLDIAGWIVIGSMMLEAILIGRLL